MNPTPFGHADWSAIVPPAVIASVALLVLFVDLVSRRSAHRYVAIGIGCAGAAAAAWLTALQYGHDYAAFGGGFMTGGFLSLIHI